MKRKKDPKLEILLKLAASQAQQNVLRAYSAGMDRIIEEWDAHASRPVEPKKRPKLAAVK
jgi:hypothetical protein